MPMLPSLALSAAVGTLHPDPDPARSWVERELSRPEYQRSLIDRFFSWLGDLWDGLTRSALGASPLSAGAAVFALVVLVVLVVLVAGRIRREPLSTRHDDGVLVAEEVSPDEHRSRAAAALDAGRYDEALVEAFRATASRAVRRGLVDGRPGLTAHELAAELAPSFPAHADQLSGSATLFDRVFYGGQPTGAADARSVLELDQALRGARPAGRTAANRPTVSAIPR